MRQPGLDTWIVDLARFAATADAIEAGEQLLSDDERRRVATLTDAMQRRDRLGTYVAVRLVLERRLGRSMAGFPVSRSPEGKPYIPGAPVAFSLSHTDGWAAIAVAPSEPIGIDIETPRARQLAEPHRDRLLAAARGLGGSDLPECDDERLLLAAWVRIEACAKASETGIARLLTALGVRGRAAAGGGGDVEAAARAWVTAQGLQVADIPGHIAAVAASRSLAIPPSVLFPSDWTALAQWRRS